MQQQQKRKRGGFAGFWDRNKKWLAPVATGVAGLFNPLAAAAIGGAVGGLDRPGKRGIGFDVGKGAMGALSGYGMGNMTYGLGQKTGLTQGLKGLFAPKGVPTITGAMPTASITAGGVPGATALPPTPVVARGVMPTVGITPGGVPGMTKIATQTATAAPSSVASLAKTAVPVTTTVPSTGGDVEQQSWLKDLFSPKGIASTAKGVLDVTQAGQANRLASQRIAQEQEQFGKTFGLQERRFAEEQRQQQLDEERRRKVASLMALFAPQLLRGVGIGGQASAAQG